MNAENYRYSSLFSIKNGIDDPLLSLDAIKALLKTSSGALLELKALTVLRC